MPVGVAINGVDVALLDKQNFIRASSLVPKKSLSKLMSFSSS